MQIWKFDLLKGILAAVGIIIINVNAIADDDTASDPCSGPDALLAIADRPTVSDSACVAPLGKILLEMGYQYMDLRDTGNAQNFPQPEVRFGVAEDNEFKVLPPNYVYATVPPFSGATATNIGFKHRFGYTKHWMFTAETILTLPSGSKAFGSPGLGAVINGIMDYSFNPQWDLAGMFGVSSLTFPESTGGQRFTSFNPDLVVTWHPKGKFQFYGEAYGQTKTAPDKGAGFNMDTGIIYLVIQNLSVDAEVGQRLVGALGGFEHYVGFGGVILF
jgi:hypothetical protein